MKKFLHTHPNFVIGGLALAFIVILIGFYLQATGTIFTQINRALAPPVAQNVNGFDLSGAAKLGLSGHSDSGSSSTGQ